MSGDARLDKIHILCASLMRILDKPSFSIEWIYLAMLEAVIMGVMAVFFYAQKKLVRTVVCPLARGFLSFDGPHRIETPQ
jgi:hypothetical protein